MNKKTILPLILFAFVIVMASCTNTKKDDGKAIQIPNQDTTGLAEYQRWKMEAEIREQIKNEKAAAIVPAVTNPKRPSATTKTSSSKSNIGNNIYRSHGNGSSASSGSGTANSSVQQPQQQRKGMSHTAKGAIVGAASGAVIGAVANKNDRLGGGVVGGVIGAAAGAGIGAIVDKKERQKN